MRLRRIEEFLRPSQKKLFGAISGSYPSAISKKGSYILVPGLAPVLLVAHLDTVHVRRVRDICRNKGNTVIMSPQGVGGDDRCGVYAIASVRAASEIKPWLLFTCDEETGAKGAKAFCEDYYDGALPTAIDGLRLIIEIDRRGGNDAVYYGCANADFERYISSKGFVTKDGSFSDISHIAPALGVAAVNLSAGYYAAHTTGEYVVLPELENIIRKVTGIVAEASDPEFPKYEYIESPYGGILYGGGYSWRPPYLSLCGEWDHDGADGEPYDEPYDVDVYDELLDIYTEEELDYYMRMLGGRGLEMLYVSEFGYLPGRK